MGKSFNLKNSIRWLSVSNALEKSQYSIHGDYFLEVYQQYQLVW